MKLRWRNCV